MITRIFTRRIASDAAIARLGQAVCFGSACLIPVIVLRRFAALELTEAELLMGVLATMSMALLCAVLGMLLQPAIKAAEAVPGAGKGQAKRR